MISIPRAYSYARRHGIPLSLVEILAMYFRGGSPYRVLRAWRRAQGLDMDISLHECELHLMAGGNMECVLDALVLAHKNDLPLPFGIAAAEDITGGDIVQIVKDALAARERGDAEHHLLLAIQHDLAPDSDPYGIGE